MKPISLSAYSRVVFFTGAGMSAESGVPTYRGRGGIWGRGDTAFAKQWVREPRPAPSPAPTSLRSGTVSTAQYRWEEYACQDAFDADPVKVLDFHEQRRGRVLGCEPHAGHRHLAALQAAHPGLSIVTQNTDGMHQRAGAKRVVELHGSLWRMRCARHGAVEDLAAAAYANRECGLCGSLLRPDITWFADAVNAAVFAQAQQLIEQAELFVADALRTAWGV